MKHLSDILTGVEVIQLIGNSDCMVEAITFDSRKVTASTLFVAVSGTHADGHGYISQAVDKGAIVVVCENRPEVLSGNVCYIKVANSELALAVIASNFYDNPSQKLRLVGVTGTNGKTTTATLLYRVFRKMGRKAGLLSTVKYFVNDQEFEATHTTPDALKINSLLNLMVTEGCEYCFMEVSSHSIVQQRIANLRFAGAIFSNITRPFGLPQNIR